MLAERLVYINGAIKSWESATVHMMSHSFGRGTALFEVMSIHDTVKGPAIFRLDQHIERLFRTVELIGVALDIDRFKLQEACLETVRVNKVKKGFVKVICYFSGISFGILPDEVPMDVAVFVIDPESDLGAKKFPIEKGTTACFSKWRKLDPQTVPVEAKASANYLNGMMARAEAKKLGYDNVIMLDSQGFVAEGGTESVFMVEDGTVVAPSRGTILLGITRLSLMELAEKIGIPARESRILPERMRQADEVFFAGTPAKLLPVRRLEQTDLQTVPGPVSKKLMSEMTEILAGKSNLFPDWLFTTDV